MTRPLILAALLVGLLLTVACSSASVRFEPIGATELTVPAAAASVRMNVVGFEEDDAGEPELRIRILVDAPEIDTVDVAVDELVLVSADLHDFGPARLVPGSTTVTGSGRKRVDVGFFYDEDADPDLSRLELDWALSVDGSSRRGPVARFRGVEAKSGWRPRPRVGVGVGPGGVGVSGGIGF